MRDRLRGRRAAVAALAGLAAWVCGCRYLPSVRMPRIPFVSRREPTAASRYEAAKRLHERGRHAEAIAALESWLADYAKTPLEPAALYYLARSQFLSGEPQKAKATYQLLAKEYEKTRWAEFATEDLAHVGAKMPNLPDYKPQRRWWHPGEWFAPKDRIVAAYDAARRHFTRGRYNQAITAFRALAERNPTSPLAPASWYWVARSHEELGQADRAREYFTVVTTKFPPTEWAKHAQNALGRLKAREGTRSP